MTSRREFLQIGITATAWPLAPAAVKAAGEISSAPLGPGLPHGVMVAMNSEPRNFLVFRWQDVAAAVKPPLRLSANRRPSHGPAHLAFDGRTSAEAQEERSW